MNYKEYGKLHSNVMILLHGGGLSWWNYHEEAKLLADKFHVIIPILNGHAGSDKEFTTIEDNAEQIISLIDEKFGGTVFLIGGLSLGGQILLEILSQRKSICHYALVESTLVIPSRLTYCMIKPVFGSCYGLIHYKWFSKLQFKSLGIRQELFHDYYRDICSISKQSMIAFLQANSLYSIKASLKNNTAKISILVGEKEIGVMKSSARIIKERIQFGSLTVMKKMKHGQFSLNYPQDYVRKIYEIINQ